MTRIGRTLCLGVGLLATACGGFGPGEVTITDRAISGGLSTSDAKHGDSYYDAYLIEAVSDGEGIVNMAGSLCTSCEEEDAILNTDLVIQRPDGEHVAGDRDSGGGTDARVKFSVAQGEQFKVIARAAGNFQRGGYRLTISENLRFVRTLPR